MYHHQQLHQPMLGPMANPNNPSNIVENKFNNMFGALSAAAAANFAAVAANNFASCPASTSSTSNSHFPGGQQQSIPSSIVSAIPVCGPSFVPPPPLATTKRERTKYSEYQLAYLEGIFCELQYPDSAKREEIARILELTDVKVQVWFKNRRAKMRNEQKFEKMKREAAKVAASRKRCPIGNVKREESVEDTEEEDPGKGLGNGEMGMTKPEAESVKQSNNGHILKSSNSPPMSSLGQFVGAIKSESPSVVPMNTFAPHHQWPTNHQLMPMEMGSLMQMAAASSAAAAATGQSQNFYSGCWPNAQSNNSAQNYQNYSSFLPSPYAGQMMFNNAMAAAYYPSNNGQYNYYFPVQQTAATTIEEQQPDLK